MSSEPQVTPRMAVGDTSSALAPPGIRKSYAAPGGPLEVLSGIDLEVRRGTILAIIGASGAGKSTLLNVLGTLDRADQGSLVAGGQRLDTMNPRQLADFRAR